MTDQTISPRTIQVWDLPTRVFHWLLVVVVTALIYTGLTGKLDLHMKLGQVALALVLFRLIWGVIGNPQARFTDFIAGPAAVFRYLGGLFGKAERRYLGHNPAGGYAVLLMLAVILVQGLSGLFTSDDIVTDGPLYSKVSGAVSAKLATLHRWGLKILLAVIGLHLAANAFYLLVKKDNLITPMVTGDRSLAPGEAAPASKGAGNLAALVLFALCLGAVFGTVAYLK